MKKDTKKNNPSCQKDKEKCLSDINKTQDLDKKKAILNGDACQNAMSSDCLTSTQKSCDCKYCKKMCPHTEIDKDAHCLFKCATCKTKSLTGKLVESGRRIAKFLKKLLKR